MRDMPQAQVVRVAICDSTCLSHSTPHLTIEKTKVELERGNAVALSYTWGDFDRSRTIIGHYSDTPESSVEMELGKEWIIPHFIMRLAQLSHDHGAIWLDQLCISQKSEELRQALASIPLIYRSLDVVALMPGHYCRCTRQGWAMSKVLEVITAKYGPAYGRKSLMQVTELMDECLNSASLSSWFERVWTRQELLYSRRIRVAWTSNHLAKCVKLDRNGEAKEGFDIANLQPFATQLWERLRRERLTDMVIAARIRSYAREMHIAGTRALLQYIQDGGSSISSTRIFFAFMAGRSLESRLTEPGKCSPMDDLDVFLVGLGSDCRVWNRTATQERDYILSIWVDCPLYQPPVEYKSMNASAMLQDSLNQLHANLGVTIMTRAPHGLFAAGPGSGVHAPSDTLQDRRPSGLGDVYQGMAFENIRAITVRAENAVPVRLLELPAAISRRAMDYDIAFSGADNEFVYQQFREMLSAWPDDTTLTVMDRHQARMRRVLGLSRIEDPTFSSLAPEVRMFGLTLRLVEVDRARQESTPTFILLHILKGSRLAQMNPWSAHPDQERSMRNALSSGVDEQLRDGILYECVATALGLDPVVCQSHGLRVMVTLGEDDAPRVGLYRRGIDLEAVRLADEGDVLTVSMGKTTDAHDAVLYEVQRLRDSVDGTDRFEVFGVWVPIKHTPLCDIGAIVDADSNSAILV